MKIMEVKKQLRNLTCLYVVVEILTIQSPFTSAAKLSHFQLLKRDVLKRDHQQQQKHDLLPNTKTIKTNPNTHQEQSSMLTYTLKDTNNLINDSLVTDCGDSRYLCEDGFTCCPLNNKCCPPESPGNPMTCCPIDDLNVSEYY